MADTRDPRQGVNVKILSSVRRGAIGTYIGPEQTAIGVLHRIEFYGDEAGLYPEGAFKFI